MIFKVAEGVEGESLQKKHCFAIEIRQSSGRFSPWSDDQMPSAASSTRSTPKIFQI
jgi:hypothetical protein